MGYAPRRWDQRCIAGVIFGAPYIDDSWDIRSAHFLKTIEHRKFR